MAKRIITFFLIYIALLISLSFINSASAQIIDSSSAPTPSYTVGLGAPVTGGETAPANFADYTNRIYQYAVVIGISLAVMMIIFGGYKYMASSGDPQSIDEAKEILIGAVVGLILILLTRLILATIDPQLLKFPRSAPIFTSTPAPSTAVPAP
ncbi:MAG: pilin [Candidatus Berkelbacteria bacterium]|nr:pilin [Candidatus Berkelbacteria bacterium]